jgi:hypothetical protein
MKHPKQSRGMMKTDSKKESVRLGAIKSGDGVFFANLCRTRQVGNQRD